MNKSQILYYVGIGEVISGNKDRKLGVKLEIASHYFAAILVTLVI